MASSFPFDLELSSLEFSDSLKSGDAAIDAEHRKLFDDARALLSAASTGSSNRDIQAAMDALVRDMAIHFGHEDVLMDQAGWDEAVQHAGIHRLLMTEAQRLVERHRASEVGFLDIYRFIVGTLVRDHLAIHDVAFHHFLREHREN